jgi:hypothetical protein
MGNLFKIIKCTKIVAEQSLIVVHTVAASNGM